jgi:hypothetical protein
MSRRTRRRRAEASYGPETGTTYLLHFIDPQTGAPARYQHAGHYIGWTQDLAARLDAHARGAGARLVEVITKAGLGFRLVRTWPGTTRDREDLLKHAGGGRRYCPECGVQPRQDTGPLTPPQRLSLYDLERAGTWLDGTPLPDTTTPTWPLPAAHRKDAAMFGRARRAAARDHAQREARAQAEADALFAVADRLDDLAGQPRGYRQQITADRAARILRQLGEPLTRDTRDPGPVLAGSDLDAEIDRLAEMFPDPQPPAPEPGSGAEAAGPAVDHAAHRAEQARQAERRAAAAEQAALRAGGGRPGSTAWQDLQDARHSRMAAEADAYASATRLQQQALDDAGPDGPDHLYGSPECAEADPETAHFGWQAAESQDAGRFPLPRILPASEVSPVRAPAAAALVDGTPHADPYLAARGWQAHRGIYTRQARPQIEAG